MIIAFCIVLSILALLIIVPLAIKEGKKPAKRKNYTRYSTGFNDKELLNFFIFWSIFKR